MAARPPAPSLQALVAGLVDYAGLFPPAGLAMSEAVAAYASYRTAPESWILGRFVVPVGRLDEMAAEGPRDAGAQPEPWRLAALAGPDLAADVTSIRAFNAAQGGRLLADVIEARASTPRAVHEAASAVGSLATLYVELPHATDPRELLEAAREAGARAKVRTGGVTADAFPTAAELARFIARCAELRVPFKATAGLHHPLRAEHRLTYAANSPSGTMFGFLNVFAAAALALAGADEPTLAALLEERDPARLGFGDDGLRWREHLVTPATLRDVRTHFATSFGSCSFREPVDDLHQLALL